MTFALARSGRAAPFSAYARAALLACASATALYGCPMYSDECDSRNDCAAGFYCDRFSDRCERIAQPLGCSRPEHCEAGETCTPDFECRPGSCDYHGCVTGYICGVVDSAHACVRSIGDAGPADAGGADASAPAPDAGGADAGELDAGDAGEVSP